MKIQETFVILLRIIVLLLAAFCLGQRASKSYSHLPNLPQTIPVPNLSLGWVTPSVYSCHSYAWLCVYFATLEISITGVPTFFSNLLSNMIVWDLLDLLMRIIGSWDNISSQINSLELWYLTKDMVIKMFRILRRIRMIKAPTWDLLISNTCNFGKREEILSRK